MADTNDLDSTVPTQENAEGFSPTAAGDSGAAYKREESAAVALTGEEKEQVKGSNDSSENEGLAPLTETEADRLDREEDEKYERELKELLKEKEKKV